MQEKKGDVIIDGGGYMGMFSIYCCKVMKNTGKIYVFEPNQKNYKKMVEKILENKF